MRILMIAPEPFFEPRGTPFSVYHRIRALTELGHRVDLVTYPFGQDVVMPGLRLFRSLRPPLIRRVAVGPSLAKIPLDACLTLTALRRAIADRYEAVHSHEEGGLIGVALAAALRVPHLYDMHSSLPEQLTNFAFTRSRALAWLFRVLERLIIRGSRVVVVICPALEETVRRIHPLSRIFVIENAPGSAEQESTPEGSAAVRERFRLTAPTPVVLYTGTFEAYQGLDLLFGAMATVRATRPDARLLLVGGAPDQLARAQQDARLAAVEDVVIFAGEQPSGRIPAFLAAADVLVSPRTRGTNTPLKIYQYLRSGKPIVATRLLTHTQVLDDGTAVLTGNSPRELGEGILEALNDRAGSAERGRRARQLAETKYSYTAYLERTRQACAALEPSGHYSYAVYRDAETARSFEARRFGGPIGEIVADAQARTVAALIGPVAGRRVLDVGTGAGRAARLLARSGAAVTAIDASDEMLAVARERAAADGIRIDFRHGDAHALEFPDRAFDVVISLRVLMHVPDWRRVVAELCRVAGELVIFDYPSHASFALLQAAARRVSHAAGAKTEPYRTFGRRQLSRELARSRYRIRSAHREFVLPIALHKLVGSRRFTLGVEGALDGLGVARVFGSPVTLAAERCARS